MSATALTEAEFTRLEGLLAPLAATSDTMRLDEVQGFFAAIASGPDRLESADWLDDVLGESPAFESGDARAEIVALLEKLYAATADALASGEVPELVLYAAEDGDEADYWPWCNAYLYALDVVPTDWFEAADDEGFEDLLYPLMALGGIFDQEEGEPLVEFTADELDNFKDELPEAVLAVYGYWRAKSNAPKTARRDAAKVGRNDPCPCGSGKKYKQCCGKE
ncbi:YecA family protein [Crenobacter cavernae]|uniref:YecA family protein n=1 Tax=Crenobacter cavernae TaxID=2290923 RepID=A0ABY0FA00_9NEIS|nr:YecA family protein [Crenobacter cavernae]RXZ42488.1 YecA family protein [Crenobacter cavernae]